MASFDLLSQLFGSKEGHQLNVMIDTEGTALLGKLGLPTSTAGIIVAAEKALDAGIEAAPGLTDAEKTVLIGLINAVLAKAGTPVAAGAPVPGSTVAPLIEDVPVFKSVGTGPEGQQE